MRTLIAIAIGAVISSTTLSKIVGGAALLQASSLSMTVSVDRKQNLSELMKNMCSNDKSRFWREIRRSQTEGIRFIILCEHGGKYKSIPEKERPDPTRNLGSTGKTPGKTLS